MVKRYKNPNQPFKWKHFAGEIILWLVRWYCRYALSYHNLQEIAAERGLKVERSTLCRWVYEYGTELAKRVKPYLKPTLASWRLDETYLKIQGVWHYLYRAVDKAGNTLDWMLSRHHNQKAAKRFFCKLLGNRHVKTPAVINVDKNPAFPPAHAALQQAGVLPATTKLRQVKYLNNRIENDHKSIKRKARYRQWYQSFTTARKTLDGMEILRVIQKGQVRYVAKGDVRAQNRFIHQLFNLAVSTAI
jgi:transposase-like protein